MTKRKVSMGLDALGETTEQEATLAVVQSQKFVAKSGGNITKSKVLGKTDKKQSVPVYLEPLLHDALHTLIFSERAKKTSFQTLFISGLELELKKRGLPSVAQLSSGEKTINL
jgi:hypothetical protein